MASDIWLRTILIVRKETHCCHIGYSYRLTARVILYAPSHRQYNTYQGLCYTGRGSLAGTRNSSMGPPHEGSIRRPITPWANALPLSYVPLLDTHKVPASPYSSATGGKFGLCVPSDPPGLHQEGHLLPETLVLCHVGRPWWPHPILTFCTTLQEILFSTLAH